MDIKEIVENFNYKGEFLGYEFFGNGNINNTLAITMKQKNGQEKRYILQNINNNVFKNIDGLMNNVMLVTEHIIKEVEKRGEDSTRATIHLAKAKNGKPYYLDSEGKYWRSYELIEHAIGYDIVENNEVFENAGKAFGKFISDLSNFDASKLYEVIPNFHNTVSRFNDFEKALQVNYNNRASEVKEEIDFFLSNKKYANKIVDMLNNDELPLRVTHNDTKLNNVLMDETTHKAIMVIDLDTIMPGSLLYDFGDAIRSGCNTGLEDEPDLSKVGFNIALFESFTKGFLSGLGNNITPQEKELLPFSALLMTYECGMRFLTDYLNGDTYFKTKYPEHNLVRTRTQIKLVKDMEKQLDKMNTIVMKY